MNEEEVEIDPGANVSLGVVFADNVARARVEVSWHNILARGDAVMAVNGVSLSDLSAAELSAALASEWRRSESEGSAVLLRVLRRSSTSTPQHARWAQPTEERSPAQPTGEDHERPWRLGRPSRGSTPDSRGPQMQGREEEGRTGGSGGERSSRSPRELLAEGLAALDRDGPGLAQGGGSPPPLFLRKPSALSLAHTPLTTASRTPAASPRADRHRAEEDGLRRQAEALREREAEVARREAAVAAYAAVPAQEGDEDALLHAMLLRAASGRPSPASSSFEVEFEARPVGGRRASPALHLPAVEQATPLHAFLANRSFVTLPPTLPAGPPLQESSAAPSGRSTRIDVPDGEPWEWTVQATPRSPQVVRSSPIIGRTRLVVAPVSPVQAGVAATTVEEERAVRESFVGSSKSAAAVFVREAASPAPRLTASTTGALSTWGRPSPLALAPPRRLSVGSGAWERAGGGWGGTSPQPALPLLASPAPQARPARPGRRGSGEGGGRT
jgi:hypothetical protein